MKRTTITIPQDLVNNLVETTKAKNKTQAVVIAIEDALKRRKMEKIKKMAGKLKFEDAYKLRHRDRRLG